MIDADMAKWAVCVAPISINGTAATDTEVDTKGWNFIEFIFITGLIGAANFDSIKLQHSDTSGSGEADITGATLTTVGDSSDGLIFRISMPLGGTVKRYISAVIDPGAVACLVCAVYRLSRGNEAPSSATERGLSQDVRIAV